jgi:hypothetical protein
MTPSEWTDTIQSLGAGLGAVVAAGFGFRHVLSKLNLTTNSDSAQQGLVNNLRHEAGKWQKLYDETHRLYEAQRDANVLLRAQVMMMRQMLINKGMTENELIAIGAILPPEPNYDLPKASDDK